MFYLRKKLPLLPLLITTGSPHYSQHVMQSGLFSLLLNCPNEEGKFCRRVKLSFNLEIKCFYFLIKYKI